MEGNQPLLDGLHVVIRAPGGLAALHQPRGHCLVADFEIEDVGAGCDFLLELLALGHLAGVAIDEESLGAGQLLEHGLREKVKDDTLNIIILLIYILWINTWVDSKNVIRSLVDSLVICSI